MGKVQVLKTDPGIFEEVLNGNKKFEIRLNDRDYQIGDELQLQETVYTGTEMMMGAPLEYTGRSAAFKVTFILHGPVYGIEDGWAVMSIERI